jgi:hypothetical protein
MENKFHAMNVMISNVCGLKVGVDEHSSSDDTRLLSGLFVN